MSNLENKASISTERTLVKVAEAVLSGATLKIIVPLHDDRNMIQPDSLLKQPYVAEIVEALQGSKPGLKDYVEKHLIPIADHYRSAANYLREKHHFHPASEAYAEWRARLANRLDQYLQSEYFQLKNADEGWQIGGPERVTDPALEDLDTLAAVAVLESVNQIAERLVLGKRAVSCKLEAIIKLAEWHSFCDTSFKLLNIEAVKEAGWKETLAKGRRIAPEKARQEIRSRLSRLIDGQDSSQYFYSDGMRLGKLKKSYVLGILQDEFDSDPGWNRKTPCDSVIHDEINKFLRK